MRLTKKQIIKLIKESLNDSQNPDNTIEKIILKECLYRLNYLKEFVTSFYLFIDDLNYFIDSYDEEIYAKMEILDARLASEDFESVSMELRNLSELRKVLIDPAKIEIMKFYIHVKRLSLQISKCVQFLEALAGKVAKLSTDSIVWCNSGKYDGYADANELIIANYSGDSGENINILQYIIDTWDSQDFIIGNVDGVAASILSQYNVSGLNTNSKLDALVSFMDPGEAFGEFNNSMAYMGFTEDRIEANLENINNLITQETPKFISSYMGNIEEMIFTLKEEKNIEFENLLDAYKSADNL